MGKKAKFSPNALCQDLYRSMDDLIRKLPPEQAIEVFEEACGQFEAMIEGIQTDMRNAQEDKE